jgi:multicomponent Na+:H+ antiporter subunit C
MEIILTLIIGLLTASGCYLLLQRRLLRVVIGLSIISQAANLVIFTAGKVPSFKPAFIASSDKVLTGATADPLPQALILTAIVIGFAMVAFFIVLTYRVFKETGTDNIDKMLESDK